MRNEVTADQTKGMQRAIEQLKKGRATVLAETKTQGRADGAAFVRNAGPADYNVVKWFERDAAAREVQHDLAAVRELLLEEARDWSAIDGLLANGGGPESKGLDPELYWESFAEGLLEQWESIKAEVEADE